MFPTGFEPSFPASERPQTHALDRKATGIGGLLYTRTSMKHYVCQDTFFKGFENLSGNYNTKYYDLNNALTSNIITVTVACVRVVPNIL